MARHNILKSNEQKKADTVCFFPLLTLIKCQSKAKPFVSDLLFFFCGINLKYATNVDSGRWRRETKIVNCVFNGKQKKEQSKKNIENHKPYGNLDVMKLL